MYCLRWKSNFYQEQNPDGNFPYSEENAKNVKEYYVLHDNELHKGEKCASEKYAVEPGLPEDEALSTSSHLSLEVDSSHTVPSTPQAPAQGNASRTLPDPTSKLKKLKPETENYKPNNKLLDDVVWVGDMPYFLALLAAFQQFSLADWGVDSSLALPSIFVKPVSQEAIVVKFRDGPSAISVSIFQPPSDNLALCGPVLKGQATCIIDATSDSKLPSSSVSLKDQDLVIKACWPETT
ncbi:hypothetical protein BDQ17DRAFT_1419217 [Cyathus striatus]|nr:hypothetical protein BDQ17DRAFT_1419217 [Cyathus striatus]